MFLYICVFVVGIICGAFPGKIILLFKSAVKEEQKIQDNITK